MSGDPTGLAFAENPGFDFTEDWFSTRTPVWDEFIRPLGDLPSVRVLEIGVFEGRATVWLLQHVARRDGDRIDCVDPFVWVPDVTDDGGPPVQDFSRAESRFWRNVGACGGTRRVSLLKERSAEALCRLPAACYDFVYVDGSHQACDVLTDAVLAFRAVKHGGLIAFDDYHLAESYGTESSHDDPQMAVDAFLACFARQVEVLHKGFQVIVRRAQ
jgi:predicted O-methyltransferase YrrM